MKLKFLSKLVDKHLMRAWWVDSEWRFQELTGAPICRKSLLGGAISAKCCAEALWRIKMLGTSVLSELHVLDLPKFSRMILIGAV